MGGDFVRRLSAPTDAAWLAFLRIGFGVLMLWHVVSYVAAGRVQRFWIDPEFHFTWPLFTWVEPWPGDGMMWHFCALGVLACFIAIGFLYRLSAALFFVGFTYVFLLEQARYQNHTYLICLLSLLLAVVPANRCAAVDARLWPAIRSPQVPTWSLWLIRFQVGVPYFFGGIAKLNSDWLRGEPLREWLPRERDFPVFGPYFDQDWAVYTFSYGGLVLDLLAVPLLLWRRTRLATFGALFLFHCSNARLFTLGVFPWLMIVLTTVFLAPDWPRRIGREVRALTRRGCTIVAGSLAGAGLALWLHEAVEFAVVFAGAVGGAAVLSAGPDERAAGPGPAPSRLVVAFCGLWCLTQLLIPLRHFLIPGNVAWTKEGQRFSWHMKLNDTDGYVIFRVTRSDGTVTEVDPTRRLAPWQAGRMDGRPDMIHQYALHLAEQEPGAEVRATARVSLNNRPAQLLIDPDVDLAREPRRLGFGHAPWIVELQVGY